MKNNLWTIMKKEFARFFGDKRMVVSVILLPGIMIYLMYTFMGSALSGQFTSEDDYQYRIAAVNLPDSVSQVIDSSELLLEVETVDADTADTTSASWSFHSGRIEQKTLDLLVIFPADFDEAVSAYSPLTSAETAPNIEIYYNSASTESGEAYDIFCGLLNSYEALLSNKFDINNNSSSSYDLASEKDSTAQIFSMLLPMLLMTFMFSACSSIAPESIAGEKERGTIATLLVTPMKRSSLAIGKICSLSIIALLGGLSSFIGTMLSIPKLMAGQMDDMSASVYGIQEYALLLAIILSTVLVIVSIISVISAFAKTVKEASTMVTPLMIIVMLVGISGMFGGVAESLPLYLIPLYNSAQCMSGIFSFSYALPQIGITAAANLTCAGVLGIVLTRMFNSEKIMY